MGILSQRGNTIVYQSLSERAELTPWGGNRIRFRSSAGLHISEENWNLLDQEEAECTIKVGSDKAVLINGKIRAEITSDGEVAYYNVKGEELLAEYWPEDRNKIAYQHHGREYRHAGGDSYATWVYFKAYPGEHLYGLGQDPNDCFDLKGVTTELGQKNTHVCIPFLYSSRGYGFLWNNPGTGRAETVKNHTLWYLDASNQVDYIVMAEDTPADTVRQLSQLTGYAPEFPEWAAGFWQCKLRYETQEELLETARQYKQRNIPISVIVIDFFHWTEQGDWKFDPRYWPDPKAMVEELNSMGIRLMVSVWPTVHKSSENYAALAEKNMLLRAESGSMSCSENDVNTTFIDPTNPEARRDVWSIIKRNYYDYGIKYFWLDVAEPEFRPYHYDIIRSYIGNGLQMSQIYPYYYEKMFYDGLREEGETEIISLSRSAWLGSQRVGTLVWSGDIPSTFDSLRRQVKAGMNMSLCGIPWWTTDIGGFIGGKPTDPEFRELIIRWFQFGLFLPVMRLHGCRVWDEGQGSRHPEVPCPSGADNEIWSFGEEAYPILQNLIGIREKLRPYIVEGMKLASADGTPLMRPLFWDFPGDKRCYEIEDQYMFGPDIMAAPVTEYGRRERTVYLPEGKWVLLGENEVIEGGRTIVLQAPVDKIPAYIRADSPLVNCL